MAEPQYCSVRGHFCTCAPRCEDDAPRGRYFDPRTKCDRCGTFSALYEAWALCRECSEHICPACEVPGEYDVNDGCPRTLCKECRAYDEPRLCPANSDKVCREEACAEVCWKQEPRAI